MFKFFVDSTPLIEAARLGNLDVVELLVNKKANIHDTSKDAKDG